MPLMDPRPSIQAARDAKHGVGAFNLTMIEHAEAFVAAAERANAPLILQISENCVRYHGSLEPVGLAALEIARQASVPVAVHLDHAEDVTLIHRAVELGFTSVMYDGSKLTDDDNRATTREVVEFCHRHGVAVEAELGEIGGKDGAHAPGIRTDPQEAKKFVEDTGVDSLAVAVGSSHAMSSRDAMLDLDLVSRLAEVVAAPLVLHGSSGVSDETLSAIVQTGVSKVNIATYLNGVFTGAVRAYLAGDPSALDTRKYIRCGRDAMADETYRLLGVLGAHGAALTGVHA